MNLVTEWLKANNKDLIEDYDGLCIDLAGDAALPLNASLIYIAPRQVGLDLFMTQWAFHAAVWHDEMVHDGWCEKPMTLKQWVRHYAGNDMEIELALFSKFDERNNFFVGYLCDCPETIRFCEAKHQQR